DGAEFLRPYEFVGVRVDADDAGGLDGQGRDECSHSDPAEPDDHHFVVRTGTSGVEDRSPSGKHGAAEHSGDGRGDVLVDGNDRFTVEHGMSGEYGRAEVVEHLGAGVLMETDLVTVERQSSGTVRRTARGAGQLPVGTAVR